MFDLFKNNKKETLRKHYENKLREAREAKSSGDSRGYHALMIEAEEIFEKISELEGIH